MFAEVRRVETRLKAEVVLDDDRLDVRVQHRAQQGILEARGHHEFIDERILGPAEFAHLVSDLADFFRRAVITDHQHFEVGLGDVFALEIILQNSFARFALGLFPRLP